MGMDPRELESLLQAAKEQRGQNPWREAWQRLRTNAAARVSLYMLIAIGAISLLAPLWPLPSPIALNLSPEPIAPVAPWTEFGSDAWQRDAIWELGPMDRALVSLRAKLFGNWQSAPWLGTDTKGRDLLARIVWGSRTSIQAALAAAFCSLAIGVLYGALAGLIGGRVDNLMMRLVDALYSVPFIFLVIFLVTILGEYRVELDRRFGIDREVVFYLVIGFVYWLTMARVVRGQVLSLRNMEFVSAARAQGASTLHILRRHILPGTLSVVIVYLTLTVPAVMLFEAFLSFLGLGVEPPKVSWGLLAVDCTEALSPLVNYWWLACFPAGAMATTLLALNVLGDGLRDALDPRLRGSRP